MTIAERHFPIGEGASISMGLMYVMSGIGSGLGPILGRAWAQDRERRLRLMIAMGYVSALVGFLIVSSLASLEAVLFGTFLRGIGGGLVWVLATQLLLQMAPNAVRGRIFSTEFALYTLFAALSSGITGGLIDTSLGATGILQIGAVLLLLPSCLWLAWIFAGDRAAAKGMVASGGR